MSRNAAMHKVLLIDDDEMLLMTIGRVLEEEGYTVLSTADGPRGIAMYEEHRPDVVLLDLGLPSMSGIEVLKEIRSRDEKARVIVVTGYGAGESVEAAIRHGACDYVQKSINIESLLEKIRSAIQIMNG
jgi:DNA-binding response OmpR family regulator